MRRLVISLAASALAAALVLACSSKDEATAPAPTGSCKALSSACHRYDKGGEGVAHDCHELGHDAKDDAVCYARKAECLAACPPIEAGAATDASAPTTTGDAAAEGDAEAAAPVDPCASYCACLGTTCSALPGYPHASPDACLAACAAFTADQKACWPKFCEEAKAGVSTTHNCEHAWGKLGLDECENF